VASSGPVGSEKCSRQKQLGPGRAEQRSKGHEKHGKSEMVQYCTLLLTIVLQYAMHRYIKAISSSLSVPGLSPRAITLFSQAMLRGQYRWGRKAKLAAGAALAIALRESHRADSLRDIAFLMEETPSSLSHSFANMVSLLRLSLSPVDPAQHFPSLQSHLSALLHPLQPPTLVPALLCSIILPLQLSNVIRTATSLSQILVHQGPVLSLNSLPTPPTACAILLLSLECEARISLPNVGDLAHLLGQRFGLSTAVVMGRYKLVQDLVEEWIRELPWLDQFEPTQAGKGRSKVAKRVVVARGLKDVVQFQAEIWKKKLEALPKPTVEFEFDDHDGDSESVSAIQREHLDNPRKRRKTCALDSASQFLLDPISSSNIAPDIMPTSPSVVNVFSGSTTASALPLTAYLLGASSTSLSPSAPPTRLQLLVAERGGSNEISDDELFFDGELEGLIRTAEETLELRKVFGWGHEDQEELNEMSSSGSVREGRTTRVDMEALARVLEGAGELNFDTDKKIYGET
jgi:transcription factor IIIB subunit 2